MFYSHHRLESKHDLHVFDGAHESGQKSVGGVQKPHHSLVALRVPVFHDGVNLSGDDAQPPRVFEAQRLGVHIWPAGGVDDCKIQEFSFLKFDFTLDFVFPHLTSLSSKVRNRTFIKNKRGNYDYIKTEQGKTMITNK